MFSVYGDGGVGKSTLLREFQQIAAKQGALCARVDERFFGLPETMNGLVADLQTQRVKLPSFSKLYSAYLRLLAKAQSGPEVPDGFAQFITQTAVQAGLHAARAGADGKARIPRHETNLLCMPRPQALLLDFYGTMVDEDTEVVDFICGEVSRRAPAASPAEVAATWWSAFTALTTACAPTALE